MCGGALVIPVLDPGEQVLELNHAGIDEHQRRVVARHKRARRDHFVPLFGKVVQKGRSDIVQRGHKALSARNHLGLRRFSPVPSQCPQHWFGGTKQDDPGGPPCSVLSTSF